jgi:Protein of unknown function (DUF3179)
MKANMAAAFLLVAVVLAGCGGSAEPEADEAPSRGGPEQARSGLGSLTVGWRTDFTRHTVPLSQFESGGPPKDGIPAIDHPRFAPSREVDFLEREEPVVELALWGQVRAYPLQILVWHEIVNDRVGGVPVAVTFCPLCNTAIVFDRRVGGRTLSFGTTGNLRNSDLVMYDRETESWWQQFGGEGVVGRYAGTSLRQLPARIRSWQEFHRDHPRGLVLTRETGHSRPYGDNPYVGYDDVSSPPFFSVAHAEAERLQPKERVVLIELGHDTVVVPFSVLAAKRELRVEAGRRELVVRALGRASSPFSERRVETVEVRDGEGRLVPYSEPFWFAVAAFRPDVEIARG